MAQGSLNEATGVDTRVLATVFGPAVSAASHPAQFASQKAPAMPAILEFSM
jgi:hypothetical protein